MKRKIIIFFFFIFFYSINLLANYILIPMDKTQTNHLKAYGLAYWIISDKCKIKKIYWLLNYRGGSFLSPVSEEIIKKAKYSGVSFEIINEIQKNSIDIEIENNNMSKVELEKAPKIAVYIPNNKNPWDDAVTLALTYAEIPFDKIWDDKILKDGLNKYDWLHSHHEDFTGQYDKFFKNYNKSSWYINKVNKSRQFANKLNFNSVREEKLAVAKKIREFVKKGGFFFAMCSATESLDVALSLEGVDYISPEIDGTPFDKNYMQKINYNNCLMFRDFKVFSDPYYNPKSEIDYNIVNTRNRKEDPPFELFDFSAKFDQVPCILTQNHQRIIKGFFGLTTSYLQKFLKKKVVVLGYSLNKVKTAKYIHINYGKGSITYLGGHDPEDYAHKVGAEPTNLNLHKHSAGYRLILNNVLFPAVKKKKLKT